ncbi:universal stress protein [Actinokineospora enzanensis]|uniref:universal stress protein n=1 Tax=Actinokineospora enzanensis TaxID=155975 RepID=UPI000365280B|nr:universal stress protein [Actinokineospora enzanensis]
MTGQPVPTRPPVVVGVDGSAASLTAVRWAAAEAAAREFPVRLVHACVPPPLRHPVDSRVQADYLDALSDHGRHWLRVAAALVVRTQPGVDVRQELRVGNAVDVLAESATGAWGLVTGGRGLDGFGDASMGSVSAALTEHAVDVGCPVIVVREEGAAADRRPVVVGVDGSPASEAAIAVAFETASVHRAPLTAVHTWSEVAFSGLWCALPLDLDWTGIAEREASLLSERLAGLREKYPDVVVTAVVERDRPVRALLDHARAARLLVVGTRGHHALAGVGLGSTSLALVRVAGCPVAVVPGPPAE